MPHGAPCLMAHRAPMGPQWAHGGLWGAPMGPWGPYGPMGPTWAHGAAHGLPIGAMDPKWGPDGPQGMYGPTWAPHVIVVLIVRLSVVRVVLVLSMVLLMVSTHMGPHGPIWALMGPYGTFWAHGPFTVVFACIRMCSHVFACFRMCSHVLAIFEGQF
jgi:hypothetical protein